MTPHTVFKEGNLRGNAKSATAGTCLEEESVRQDREGNVPHFSPSDARPRHISSLRFSPTATRLFRQKLVRIGWELWCGTWP